MKKDPLPRVFLVHGSEMFWHRQILAVLQERVFRGELGQWNWSVFYGSKDFEEEPLLVELATLPWGGTEKIVVLKEANLIPAATMERIALWLQNHPTGNCLALFFERLDNRLKFIKIIRKMAWEINCAALEGDSLQRYVQDYCLERGRKINRKAVDLFLERVGSDLSFVHNELDKLLALREGEEEIRKEDIESLTSLSPVQLARNTIFQMTDFLVQGERQKALQVLDLLLRAGEPPLRILPVIERQLRLVLAVKSGRVSLEEIASQMGESSTYPLKKIRPSLRRYTIDKIFQGLAAIIYADREIKLGEPGDQVLRELIVRLT